MVRILGEKWTRYLYRNSGDIDNDAHTEGRTEVENGNDDGSSFWNDWYNSSSLSTPQTQNTSGAKSRIAMLKLKYNF